MSNMPRPVPPPPNGNVFNTYVSEALEYLLDKQRDQGGWFRGQITLGNLLTLSTIVVAAVTFYVRSSDHQANHDLHPTAVERQAEFDSRFDLKLAPVAIDLANIKKQHDESDKKLDEALRLLYRSQRKLESFDRR